MSGDLVALLVVLVATAAAALWWRSRQGQVRRADGAAFGRAHLGAPAGPALVVEFTAPGCLPCGRTEAILSAATAGREDVLLVTADVGEHLDLARAHGVLRAPTTLVVDADDRVRHRISGVPTPADVEAVLDDTASRPEAA